jgi:hypothetical protein
MIRFRFCAFDPCWLLAAAHSNMLLKCIFNSAFANDLTLVRDQVMPMSYLAQKLI